MKAREVKTGDHIGDRTVRWVMSPLRAGVHELLPNGGTLITFTDDTQIGMAPNEDVPDQVTSD